MCVCVVFSFPSFNTYLFIILQHIPISCVVCMLTVNSYLDCGLVIPVPCVVCPCLRVIACNYVNLRGFLLMWTKWHCWGTKRLQEQTNTVEYKSTSQIKYTFQGKFKSQTKHLLMNVMEYFDKETKKCKGHPNVLERVSKATSKAVCVV